MPSAANASTTCVPFRSRRTSTSQLSVLLSKLLRKRFATPSTSPPLIYRTSFVWGRRRPLEEKTVGKGSESHRFFRFSLLFGIDSRSFARLSTHGIPFRKEYMRPLLLK